MCDTSKDSTGAVLQNRSRRTFALAWSTRIGVVSVGVGVFLASRGYAFVSPLSVKPSLPRSRDSSLPSPKSGAGEIYMSERRGLWPSRQTIDLRSDTVTQPTAGMRKAMHKVGINCELSSSFCRLKSSYVPGSVVWKRLKKFPGYHVYCTLATWSTTSSYFKSTSSSPWMSRRFSCT